MPSRRFAGVGLLALGLALLAVAGAYYAYTYFGSRNLDRLVFQAEITPDPGLLGDLAPAADGVEGLTAPPPAGQALYPGAQIPARQWSDLRGTLDLGLEPRLTGFTPVTFMGDAVEIGPAAAASRVIIPALEVDAVVEELQVLDLQDSRAYETPKHTVGHIPGTPNPGVTGNGWYFGHLESPIQGEGNVFSQLPRVPALLADGEDVFVITESAGRQYLYQVTETDLIHQDDIRLYQAGDAQLTLVTCFPRLQYDQRLLVTAKLVGFKNVGLPGA